MTAPVRDELLLLDVPLNDHTALQAWVIGEHMPGAEAARRDQAKRPGRPPLGVAYIAIVRAAYLEAFAKHGTATGAGLAVAKRLGVAPSLGPNAEDRLFDALKKLDPAASSDVIVERLNRYVAQAGVLLAEEEHRLLTERACQNELRRADRHVRKTAAISG